jgi:hypothetical protein
MCIYINHVNMICVTYVSSALGETRVRGMVGVLSNLFLGLPLEAGRDGFKVFLSDLLLGLPLEAGRDERPLVQAVLTHQLPHQLVLLLGLSARSERSTKLGLHFNWTLYPRVQQNELTQRSVKQVSNSNPHSDII